MAASRRGIRMEEDWEDEIDDLSEVGPWTRRFVAF